MKLVPTFHDKPWGRNVLPPPFDGAVTDAANPIGEIWFEPPDGSFLPVLVKHLFTGAKLSVQVHPDDDHAVASDLVSGKNECWYITAAEPDAMLGLGLTRSLSQDELKVAALDGSIENLLGWRPIRPGQFYVVPAGTIHAMSGGISLIEFQQNADVTYRLYDYGRPRELHLDDAVTVADAGPYPEENVLCVDPDGAIEQPLAHFPQFDVIYSRDVWSSRANRMERAMWVVPLAGEVVAGGERAVPGELLYLPPNDEVDPPQQEMAALIGIAIGDEISS